MTSPGEERMATIRSQAGQSFFVWVHLPSANTKYLALVDCGATVSTLTKTLYDQILIDKRQLLAPADVKIRAGNDTRINCLGMADFTVRIENYEIEQRFYVCTDETISVLGTDFLKSQAVCLDFGSEHMFLKGEWIPVCDDKGKLLRRGRAVTTEKAVRVPARRRTVIQAAITQNKTTKSRNDRLLMVAPRRDLWCTAHVSAAYSVGREHNGRVAVEVCNPNSFDVVIKAHTYLGNVEEPIDIADYTDQTTAAPDQPAEPVANSDERPSLRARLNHLRDTPITRAEEMTVPEHLTKMYQKNCEGLNQEEDQKFRWLLNQYSDVFATDGYDLGNCNLVKHHIDTGNERPVKHHTRRLQQPQYEECEKQIGELYKAGRIRPSNSPWGSNVLLVKKKDGTWRMCIDYRELNTKTKNNDPYLLPRIDDTIDSLGRAKYFCTLDLIQGYHQVELTESSKEKTAFVVPRMNPSQWEFNFMPFGVQGGPSTFQRLMDRLLQGLAQPVAQAYLDDVIVFGATPFVCLTHLQLVFERLREANLKLKPKKCEFFKKEILYLGHIVSGEGIKCDPAKIEAMRHWTRPHTARQVKVFLGTVNYYNRFLQHFSHHAHPLFQLTKKSNKFKWTEECQIAFEDLKNMLINAPVMGYPQDEGLFILDTDASPIAMGAVLSQLQQDESSDTVTERVIAYGSRTLHKSELLYCERRQELLSVVHFAKVFRPYLYGRKVIIRTDHASLKYIKTLEDPNEQFMRWIERLEEADYEIEVRAPAPVAEANAEEGADQPPCGGKRCICDGVTALESTGAFHDDYTVLSPAFDDEQRHAAVVASWGTTPKITLPEEPGDSGSVGCVNAFTFTQLWTAEEMAEAQQADPDIALLYRCKTAELPAPPWKDISGGSAALGSYWHDYSRMTIHNTMLYRKWESRNGANIRYQLVLPYKYQEQMARHFHDDTSAAHLGRRRTIAQVHRRAYWYKMAEDLTYWIRTCEVCQRRKRQAHPGHAPQTIYTTGKVNERVSLDICGPLIETPRGNKYVLVITDQFSKFTRAFALPNHQAATVARCFLNGWICLIGAPRQVHTDQGREFESALFAQLCTLFKSEKTRTSSYHPSSDGTVERWNQTMAAMLNALVVTEYENWDLQLAYACQAYNGTKHSTTDVEPNRLMFTEMPYTPFDVMVPAPPGEEEMLCDDYIMTVKRRMRKIYQIARDHANRSATVTKRYNDRKANFHQYAIGDTILLKNYRFTPGIKKMQDRYYGPFFVLDLIGNLNLRVAADSDANAEVVHHDRAKPYYARRAAHTNTDWIYRRSLTYQRKPPMTDTSTQVDDLTLTQPAVATTGDNELMGGAAQPSETLQRKLDVAEQHAAEDHIRQAGSSHAEPEPNPVGEESLAERNESNLARTSYDQSKPLQFPECWAPKKTVTVTRPEDDAVLEIQKRKRGRPPKHPPAVTAMRGEKPTMLLREIVCARSTAYTTPTLYVHNAASQTC